MKKSFAVLGLGKFGMSLARELSKAGAEVLGVDIDKEMVHEVADDITCAMCADVRDAETLETLGLSNMDAVIVAITGDLNASVMATICAKEAGVPFVMAKAEDDIHTKILKKVGADKVIIPERESGTRTARMLLSTNIVDFIELSKNICLIEEEVKQEWVGKNLRELNLRQKHKMNVVALRKGEEVIANISPDKPLEAGMRLMAIMDRKDLPK